MATINLSALSDSFIGSDNSDNIYGNDGDDTIYGGGGNDNVRGGAGRDQLYGGEGNDFLDGGEGADRMIGGVGNDTYVVDDISDVVIESAGEGIDTVKTWINYTLRPNVENLELLGDEDLNGSGNELNNSIKGNVGDNHLFGGGGADSIAGGAGDDVINGGEGDDYLDGGTGVDLVSYKDASASVSIDLGKEKQVLSGSGRDTLKNFENLEGSHYSDVLTGNAADNKILGLGGNDVIKGGHGNDQLFGGEGEDHFVFSAASVNGTDYIRDFASGEDKLVFSVNDGYAIDALFTTNSTGLAAGSGAQFVFNSASKSLSYDADGQGGAEAQVLAHLGPSSLQWGDFIIA